MVIRVDVRGAVGVTHPCNATEGGFRCGRCGKGNLGREPKKGDFCRVCGAEVSHVVTVPTGSIPKRHHARTVPNRAFLDRLQKIADAGIDLDAIPLDLTVGDLMRLPIERIRIYAERNKECISKASQTA